MSVRDEFPSARISNGRVEAVVYLPDAERGFYRGPRFDWSGMVAVLRCGGHDFFGEWKDAPHDPLGNDFVVGPACEFGMGPETGNPSPPGFEDAAPGATFLKIGVGELRRPDEAPYHFGAAYQIVQPAPWVVRKGDAWIEFRQEARIGPGWGYRYVKRIELASDRPEMLVRYTLENAGDRRLRQTWYCHNFIRVDDHRVGTGYRLELPFAPKLSRVVGEAVEALGNGVAFVKDLGPSEGIFAVIEGHGSHPSHNAVVVRCAPGAAAVRIKGDAPVCKFHLFATGLAVCPELFVAIDLEPGASRTWSDRYTLEV